MNLNSLDWNGKRPFDVTSLDRDLGLYRERWSTLPVHNWKPSRTILRQKSACAFLVVTFRRQNRGHQSALCMEAVVLRSERAEDNREKGD